MFNSSIDAYGSVKKSAVPQNVGSQIALLNSGTKKTVDDNASKQAVEVDNAVLVGAVKKLNDYVAPALQTIEFSVDQQSERMVVKVVDTATQTVLRQIPNEEVLAMSKTLDKLQGLVVRQTA